MKLCLFPRKTADEVNKLLTSKKNKKMAAAFAAIPYADRVIFVPHCMRHIEKCKAKEMGAYYICAECNACKIAPISRKAKALGYKALFILKGGKAIDKLIQEQKPKAIVGVACFFEGVLGMKHGEKHKVAVQFVPLTKDGCVATDVDIDEVLKVLEKK